MLYIWNNAMSSTVCDLYRKVNNILADFFLLIAIHYLYYLIYTVCLYMKITCLFYIEKV